MAAPDTDTIVALYDSRRLGRHSLHRMAGEIQKITRGTFAVPLPEMDKDEAPAIANLVAIGIDQHAMRIASVMPEIDFNPVRTGIKGYQEKARKRRQAMLGILERNGMKLKGRRRARRLVAYASAPVLIRPDFELGIPKWHVRDPLGTYPAPTADPDEMLPPDTIFDFTRTWSWLQSTYPDKATQLYRKDTKADTEFTLLEYVDSEEVVLIVLGHRSGGDAALSFNSWDRGRTASGLVLPNGLVDHGGTREAVELERTPNYARMPLAVVPGRITTDDAPAGQFDSMIGKYRALAEMDALTRIAIKRGIYPDTWIIGRDDRAAEVLVTPNGVKGRFGELKNGDVKTVTENPTYLSFPAQDRLERAMRLEGAVPAEFGGECVDEETEILTADGWKRYDGLAVGEEVLTLNHETGLSEWQPVLKVNVHPAAEREVVEMEGPRFSALTTTNHRWPVIRRSGERTWRTSTDLTSNDRIPLAAVCADLPTEAKWSDALVELVAWFWTEGHFRDSGAEVSQSIRNAGNLERIRACLRALFGPPTEMWRTLSGGGQGGVGHDGVPRWADGTPGPNGVVKLRLSKHAADIVAEHAPGKVPTHEFLRSLTAAQLELFIHVSMLADNCGPDRLGQKDRARSEAFAFACILSGRGVSFRHRVKEESRPGWRQGPYEAHIVRLRKRRVVKPVENAYRGASTFRQVRHDGIVWCPTTPNQSWLARRRGSVYFTGNSPSNVRTGRRGDAVLSAVIDFPIQEHQEILAFSYEVEVKAAIAVQKGFMGDRSVSYYVNWKGAKGPVEYTPDDLFDNDDVKVSYAYVGADLNDLTLQIGQRLGIGTLSQTRAMEIDPMVDDVEAEKDQIVADALMRAVLTSIETMAADPTGPYQPVDLAWIAERVTSGEMELPQAIQKAQERAQQRQATAGPPGTEEGAALPGSPEAQPGLSQPGQGVETPIGPSEGTGGLAALLSGLSVPSRFERIAG